MTFPAPPSTPDIEEMKGAFAQAGLRVFERGWLSSNNVLFDRGETALVDTGYFCHQEQTLRLVRQALGSRPLSRIVNTHLHSDHCGGNRVLQDAFDCRIDVPEGERDSVDRWDEETLSYRATGQKCARFRRTGTLSTGQQIELGDRPWDVIASPGHDTHSVVLFQRELGLLISADALWGSGLGVIFPELEGQDAFGEACATLDLISELPVRWVIPGHGAPFADVPAAIARARSRVARFCAEPSQHGKHAAKVLIKFRLLETQYETFSSLAAWIEAAPYLRTIHRRHFPRVDFAEWWKTLVTEMSLAGALKVDETVLTNA